jgi:hypothetical protein
MKEELKLLLAKGNTKKLIDQLLEIKNQLDEEVQESILIISSRWKNLQKQKNRGEISNEQESIHLARIHSALLSVIEEIPPQASKNSFNLALRLRSWLILIIPIVIITFLVMTFVPQRVKSAKFDLAIFYYQDSMKSKILNKGKVRLLYSNKTETRHIEQDGRMDLNELSQDLRGEYLFINPAMSGFDSSQIKIAIPQNSNKIDVIIPRIKTRLIADVVDRNGNLIPNLTMNFSGNTGITDQNGRIDIELPFEPDQYVNYTVYEDDRIIYSSKVTLKKDHFLIIKIDKDD